MVGQSGRFSGRTARHQKVDAGVDLPTDQFAQSLFIQAAILLKGSDKGGTATTQLHWKRIIVCGRNLKNSPLLLAISFWQMPCPNHEVPAKSQEPKA